MSNLDTLIARLQEYAADLDAGSLTERGSIYWEPPLVVALREAAEALIALQQQLDEARAQFDRHVEWASLQTSAPPAKEPKE